MEYLAYYSAPVVFLIFAIALNLVLFELGRLFGKRWPVGDDSRDDAAFAIAQGAIFGMGALIVGFSFSFVASRFELRRTFVTTEANAIGTTYLRAAYLPAPEAKRFRAILKDYTRLRLFAYSYNANVNLRLLAESRSIALQDSLWDIVVKAGRSDPRNVQLGLLTQTVNETIDVSASQAALFKNHMPIAITVLIVMVSALVSLLVGVTFGRNGTFQPVISIVLCVVFAFVIFEIIDLDRPQSGFIRTNLAPLQTQLNAMR